MKPYALIFLGLSVAAFSWDEFSDFTQPEQVHLAYGEDPTTEMYVVWNTFNDTASEVLYNQVGSTQQKTASGVSRKFTDGGSLHRVQYIHRVKVTGLTPGKTYEYTCGSSAGWSDQFQLTTQQAGSAWSPRLAVFGDLGAVNPQSLTRLEQETKQGMYDAVLHVGDFAYDLFSNNAEVGDQFMRQIEPIAANIPYMTCPGNHENSYNFSNYRNRFVMPTDELGDKMFFSFNMGPAHIISFSTEYYYYLNFGLDQVYQQYNWLLNDLKEATKPENRAKRPWIITMGHRPMYCSNLDADDCTRRKCVLRVGSPALPNLGLENLFYDFGVDLMLWAHEHSYERLWPIYDGWVYNGTDAPYTNPAAPVHVITGSAGCKEDHDPFPPFQPYYSAYRSDDYGYTRMTIHNGSHLYIEQVSDDKGGVVIDKMWYIKDKHGMYPEHSVSEFY